MWKLIFSAFKRPKRRVEMATLMLLLPTEATTEEKTNTCTDPRCPAYHCTSRTQIIQENLHLCIKTRHNQHRRRRGDRKLEWERTNGSLTSVTIVTNFELKTDTAVFTHFPISYVFSTSRALHCWSNKGLSRAIK